jgi:hypothetical protein
MKVGVQVMNRTPTRPFEAAFQLEFQLFLLKHHHDVSPPRKGGRPVTVRNRHA